MAGWPAWLALLFLKGLWEAAGASVLRFLTLEQSFSTLAVH